MRALLIEDDKEVACYVGKGLKEQGFTVDVAIDGKDGLGLASTESYDVMIIDRMLPKLDGLAILKSIRAAENQTPVIILSALGEVDDRVKGLKSGGDDYIVKPFSFSELLARMEALIRRSEVTPDAAVTSLEVGDLEMDLLSRKVTRAGVKIELQSREFKLLEYLVKHQGQVVTRTMLLENVWNYHFDPQTNVIDVHISRLRAKIDKEFDHPLIRTVRGAGYVIEAS